MTDDIIRRGQRWRSFFEEEGGLQEMIAEVGHAHLARMAKLKPWEAKEFANHAIGLQIARDLELMVRNLIAGGTVAEVAREHARKIEALPDRKKRLLGYLRDR